MTKINKQLFKQRIRQIKKEQIVPTYNSSNEIIKELKDKITKKAKFELTDVGYFNTILESVKNGFAGFNFGTISLRIDTLSQDKNAIRRLEAIVTNKTERYESSILLAEGKRNEILNALKSKDFDANLKEKLYELSTDFLIKQI